MVAGYLPESTAMIRGWARTFRDDARDIAGDFSGRLVLFETALVTVVTIWTASIAMGSSSAFDRAIVGYMNILVPLLLAVSLAFVRTTLLKSYFVLAVFVVVFVAQTGLVLDYVAHGFTSSPTATSVYITAAIVSVVMCAVAVIVGGLLRWGASALGWVGGGRNDDGRNGDGRNGDGGTDVD